MGKNVIVVGGGIAGLTAAIYLARAGRSVTVFEKRRALGGRAVTHLRRGFRFNLGAHAVYRGGAGLRVYRELGIPVRGGVPRAGGTALFEGEHHRLPLTFGSFFTSSLLGVKGKLELAKLLWRIRGIDPKPFAEMTEREWLEANVSDARLRLLMEALMRLATYSDRSDQSAAVALSQLQLVIRKGVLYIHEGWQKLVDSLHSSAISAGVNFVSTSRIVRIEHDGKQVRGVELGGLEIETTRNDTLSVALPDPHAYGEAGTRIPADTVLLAIDPTTAAEIVDHPETTSTWTALTPVTVTCLDVALSSLPQPHDTFALGIDQPLYLSVHSAAAQLTPKGGALIHLAKYRQQPAAQSDDEIESSGTRKEAAAGERELEVLLDEIQPGWRDVLVHRRYLPSMTVSNALVTPATRRADPVTAIRGLYVAGDWVGNEGLLSDAALTSARAAARAVLAAE